MYDDMSSGFIDTATMSPSSALSLHPPSRLTWYTMLSGSLRISLRMVSRRSRLDLYAAISGFSSGSARPVLARSASSSILRTMPLYASAVTSTAASIPFMLVISNPEKSRFASRSIGACSSYPTKSIIWSSISCVSSATRSWRSR